MVTNNQKVLLEAVRCFAKPVDRPQYFSLYSDNVILHGYDGVQPGLNSVKSFYERFWSAFPDASIEVHDLFGDDEKVVLRYNVTATHSGSFLEIQPTRRRIDLPGISVLKFHNVQCVERWTVSDSLVLLRQLRGDM